MPGNTDLSAAKRQLIQLLATLMMAYPERITIIDRKQQEWLYTESVTEEQFTKTVEPMAVQLHAVKNKKQQVIRWVSIIKMRTSTTLQEWQNDDEYYRPKSMHSHIPSAMMNGTWSALGFLRTTMSSTTQGKSYRIHWPDCSRNKTVHHQCFN